MSVSSSIVLRYRAAGHVRYQLSVASCNPPARRAIEAALRGTEGIYRVDFFARQRKISIRYIETVCSFEQLDLLVHREAEASALAAPIPSCCAAPLQAGTSVSERKHTRSSPLAWARTKLAGAGVDRTIPAMPWLKESTVVEFLNDALVLFLIKLHWHMITQHWLRQPWRYRYEWLAALYMIYLLVRSRRPKKN